VNKQGCKGVEVKRIIVLLALSLGLSLWFIKLDLHIQAWASTGRATSNQQPLKQAGSSERISVTAAGRGNPLINLLDGIDLKTAYFGAAEIRKALEPDRSMPLALVVGDFDGFRWRWICGNGGRAIACAHRSGSGGDDLEDNQLR